VVVVEKKEKGVLYGSRVNGKIRWYKSGNEKKDSKYVGEIENGVPNGQGIVISPDGRNYVGKFKDGERNGQGTITQPDGKKYVGEWKNGKPWNGNGYDRNGYLKVKYSKGKKLRP